MRFSNEEIQIAKSVSMVHYLASKGILPVDKEAGDWLYYSPLREDKNPSFYLSEKENGFIDFTREEHKGDVITLVMLLEQKDFVSAVRQLLSFRADVIGDITPLSFPAAPTEPKKGIEVLYERPITLDHLKDYTLSRKIPLELANRYLKEVRYVVKGQKYWALGFKNDSGGYELRNEHFKGSSMPKDITTFHVPDSEKVAVFEGFFDFLSALMWFGLEKPRISTVILNSTSNRNKALPFLKKFKQHNCFLDRDDGGLKFIESLNKESLILKDYSFIYKTYKDFNELLIKFNGLNNTI